MVNSLHVLHMQTLVLTVDTSLSAVHLCMASPTLMSTEPSIGVAGTKCPSRVFT